MNIPQMIPVQSSNVHSVGYDENEHIVYVGFNNGSMYRYKGVSKPEFEALLTAPSVGSYLNRNYKNVYPYERIK